MGTRADFYVGRGADAEWIGSIAWDGYPQGIIPHTDETEIFLGRKRHKKGEWPEGAHLFDATTEAEYRERVTRFFRHRDDVTLPADGWPWPWDDSRLTDVAYAFDEGRVWHSWFGRDWWPSAEPEPDDDDEGDQPPREKTAVFPDMANRKAVTCGPRSGLIVVVG